MEEGTQKALMVGIPLAIAGIAAALYFATRPPPPCTDLDIIIEQCPEGSMHPAIQSHICRRGQWQPTGAECVIRPPELGYI